MSALAAFGIGLATAALLLTLVWVIQLFTRNAGLVDVVWSAAVGLIAAEYALLGDAPPAARILLAALALTWAMRLAGYLAKHFGEEVELSELCITLTRQMNYFPHVPYNIRSMGRLVSQS